MGISFVSLYSQLESCDTKLFFGTTPKGLVFCSSNSFFRFTDSLFRGRSYDLSQASKLLIKSVQSLLNPPKSSHEEELVAALKCIKIAEKLLVGAVAKTHGTERAAAQKECAGAAEALAAEIAIRRKSSKIEVLLELGCFSEVVSTLKKDGYPNTLPASLFEPLLEVACNKKQTDLCLMLLHRRVSTKTLSSIEPAFFAQLARKACTMLDDQALSHLIEEEDFLNGDRELYFQALEKGLVLSVTKFIEKGKIPSDWTDKEKNTALHIAFVTGNYALVNVLLPNSDPFTKNSFSQTPIQALLKPQGKRKRLSDVQIKEFLECIFKRDESPGVSGETMSRLTDGVVSKSLEWGGVELCFLLQKELRLLSKDIYRDDVEGAMHFLKKKYPKASLDEFFMSSFAVNLEHLKTGCENYNIPQKAPPTPLEALYTIFDALSWDKSSEVKLYLNVFGQPRSSKEEKTEKELLKEQLDTLVRKIREREEFIGTPPAGKELEKFYSQIEICLRSCAAELMEHKNPDLVISFMREILQASTLCGGRHFQTAINQYLLLCRELEETPRGIFERHLAAYRRICFEGVVGYLYRGQQHSIHALTHATKDLGVALGIPGAGAAFDDKLATHGYKKEDVRRTFFQAYTPSSILFSHLDPLVHQDNDARALYLDFQKEAMLPTWKEGIYGQVYSDLKKIPHRFSKEEQRAAVNKVLEKYDIARAPGQDVKEAIEADRMANFLGTFVHDEQGNLTRSGMIFLLERFGIITSQLKWKDPTKEVPPLPWQTPYRKISLWEQIRTGIRKVFALFG